MDSDFLSSLRKAGHSSSSPKGRPKAVSFRLRKKHDGGMAVGVVDAATGKLLRSIPDASSYGGVTADILRAFARKPSGWSVGWDGEEASAQELSVDEHPELVYMLSMAGNVVDESGNKVVFDRDSVDVGVEIVCDDSRRRCRAQLMSREYGACSMVGDAFVACSDGKIRPINDGIGCPAPEMNALLTDFDMVSLAEYLSILVSMNPDIEIVIPDMQIKRRKTPRELRPTIIFDSVDADKALYMRAVNSVEGLDPKFSADFELHYVAEVDYERKVIDIHPLEASDGNPVQSLLDDLYSVSRSKAQKSEIYNDGNLFIVQEEAAARFLYDRLPALLDKYRLIGSEKLREYNVTPVRPKLNLKLGSGIDFLEGDATVEVGEEKISLADLLRRYNKNRYVELGDGTRALLDSNYIARLKRIFSRKPDSKGHVKVSFFDLPEIEKLLDGKVEGAVWKRHRQLYEGFNKLKDQKLETPRLNGTLRPYQADGVKWLKYLWQNKIGGCLADDMGLGKTIQTIAVLADVYPDAKLPSLIVMPRSLVFNWESELKKFAPQLDYYIYYGNAREFDEARGHQVVLTTYALVRNDIEKFKEVEWESVWLDESQSVKNVGAQVSQAVQLLKSDHRFAISGTPIENNLMELYSLFRFLNPAMFGSAENFAETYAAPIERAGDAEASAALRRKVFPFILRRLKANVVKDLPPMVEQTLWVEMEEDHARAYERRRRELAALVDMASSGPDSAKARFVMLQAITELRQLASVPEKVTDGRVKSKKLEMLVDNVADVVAAGRKVVVFFNFLAGIRLAEEELQSRGIRSVTMTGATADRGRVVREFTSNRDCNVMLMTIKTGGTGLNLVVADTAFIFEPWWNTAAEAQAKNRLHRIGQTSKVMAYSMLVKGTIEEKMRELQEKKALLVDDIISSDSASKHLTDDDIRYLLS